MVQRFGVVAAFGCATHTSTNTVKSQRHATIKTRTDERGRFSLAVLKGLRGELVSTYPPDNWEFERCPPLKKLLQESGQRFLVFYTERLTVEAIENRTFELTLPVSPCR
jgi:hypothetical protein